MISRTELLKQLEEGDEIFENLDEQVKIHYYKDQNVMEMLIKLNCEYITSADISLLKNEDFLKFCLKEDIQGVSYDVIPKNFLSNKEFMEYALDIHPELITYSPLVNDIDLVKKILEDHPKVYRLLNEDVRDRDDIIEIVLYNSEEWTDLMDGLTERKLSDKDFILKNLTQAYDILNYIDKDLKKEKDLVLKVLKNNSNLFHLEDIDESLRENRDIIKQLLIINAEEVKKVSNVFSKDKMFLLEVAKEEIMIVEHMSEDILYTKDFLYQIKQILNEKKDNFDSPIFKNINSAIDAFEREEKMKAEFEKQEQKKSRNKLKV